jgi:Na+/proline symporter
MFGFPVADLIAIAVYFAAVLIIGVWASRRIKNEEDYFLAGRHLPITPQAKPAAQPK